MARQNVLRRFHGLPYSVLDVIPERRPVLVETDVPEHRAVDVVTDAACRAAGLPVTYPRQTDGSEIGWDRCRSVGLAAWDQGEPSIACRSAAAGSGREGEELAWLVRDLRLRVAARRSFDDWFK